MTKVYAKVNGKLAVWQFEGDGYADAVQAVRQELGSKYVGAVLAAVK
jgi:hypothetical protein